MSATTPLPPDFIGLFFPAPVEAEIAVRWAQRLGAVIGSRVNDLRPDTSLADIMQWAVDGGADSMNFVVVFEPELRRELARFVDDAAESTFRDMVVHAASWYPSAL